MTRRDAREIAGVALVVWIVAKVVRRAVAVAWRWLGAMDGVAARLEHGSERVLDAAHAG